MEQVEVIETPFVDYKTTVIAVILNLHLAEIARLELAMGTLTVCCLTTWLYPSNIVEENVRFELTNNRFAVCSLNPLE